MPQLKKIAVLISGGGSNLQTIIDHIAIGNINGEISIVISNRKDAFGLERAKNHGIEALYINQKEYTDSDAYNKKILEELTNRNIDLIILAGYLKILSAELVNQFKNRIINIHPSLIPAFCGDGYYGLKVHQAAIDHGVKISGATVHFVDEQADTGPIILQKCVSVDCHDTADTLQKKVLKIEHEILPLAVKLFCEDKIFVNERKVMVEN